MLMRTTIDLNFDWTFKKQFSPEDLARPVTEDYETVDLPHCYPTLPFNYPGEEYRGYVSLYKKEFFLNKKHRGKIVNIVFEGVAHMADVYLNGKHVGRHEGGYDRFCYNLNKYLNF